MALQSLLNSIGFPADPFGLTVVADTAVTLDAAGESLTFVGHLHLSTGPGTSKTFSSAGGKVAWLSRASVVFANAGSNLRIGIQDVSAGLEDGTFDVYADLVGGTDTIASSTAFETAMETGTKSIAHGDIIAISIELTTRGGADSVTVRRPSGAVAILNSYATIDSGSGPARSAGVAGFALITDDGTIGWIRGGLQATAGVVSFGNGSTPDEYALLFQLPFPASCLGVVAALDDVASGDTFEYVLYSDPLGVTPVAERSVALDPDLISGATNDGHTPALFTTPFSLAANTLYGVSVRPTSAGTITIARATFSSAGLRAMTRFGTNSSQGTRSDNAGAFTQTTTILPQIGPILTGFDDATGGASGMVRHPGMNGGLNG